jgi:hypothetical protein
VKKDNTLKLFFDGDKVDEAPIGDTVGNTGSLYIGKDPWYNGVAGAGFDNF